MSVAVTEVSIHQNVNLKCLIAGKYVKEPQKILRCFNSNNCQKRLKIHRSQKKNIQVVPIEKCQKKMDRCKKNTEIACKSQKKQNSFFGKEDKICGTDSKTYANECELQKATCL